MAAGLHLRRSRLLFPDGLPGEYQQLPIMYPCEITKDNIRIATEDKMEGEEISEITPEVFEDGYNRIVGMLQGKADEPLYFDEAGGIGIIAVGYQPSCVPATEDEAGCFNWADLSRIEARVKEI